MGISKYECMIDALNHNKPKVIPNYEEFFDINSEKKFLPRFATSHERERKLKQLEFMGNYIANVGSGRLQSRVIEETKNYKILEFENGSKHKIVKDPYFVSYIYYPIKDGSNLGNLYLPDPDDESRYQEIIGNLRYFREKGYFTLAKIHGFFSGIWYHCRKFEDFMTDMVTNKNFARELIDKFAAWNLRIARNLLEIGIDSLLFNDDLGDTTGMLISPQMYREYFYPWHKKLISLCHHYGRYAHMHSHGNINAIMSLLAEAKLDILNPVGPGDNMDLADLKRKFGSKITFCGGISKFIGEMSQEELDAHLKKVVKTGAKNGGFITRSEGGIPYNMTGENFLFYIRTLKKYREKFGS